MILQVILRLLIIFSFIYHLIFVIRYPFRSYSCSHIQTIQNIPNIQLFSYSFRIKFSLPNKLNKLYLKNKIKINYTNSKRVLDFYQCTNLNVCISKSINGQMNPNVYFVVRFLNFTVRNCIDFGYLGFGNVHSKHYLHSISILYFENYLNIILANVQIIVSNK